MNVTKTIKKTTAPFAFVKRDNPAKIENKIINLVFDVSFTNFMRKNIEIVVIA